MTNIWLYGDDPGGANVVFPLKVFFEEKGFNVSLFGSKTACKIYNRWNIKYKLIDFSYMEIINKYLIAEKPDVIITGTSSNSFIEQNLWSVAKKNKIKSMAIIDQWMNYGLRFSRLGSKNKHLYKPFNTELNLPDIVGIMDKDSYKDAINDGIQSERLKIIGQPYFNWLLNIPNKDNIDRKNTRILFASEPLTEDYKNVPGGAKRIFGYDEVLILKNFIKTVEKLENIELSIRLHPREKNMDKFKKILDNTNILWNQNKDNNSIDAINKSDLIVGMSSMFLIEAYYLKKKVLSLQYNRIKEDNNILSKRKLINVVEKEENTFYKTSEILNSKLTEKINFAVSDYSKIAKILEV